MLKFKKFVVFIILSFFAFLAIAFLGLYFKNAGDNNHINNRSETGNLATVSDHLFSQSENVYNHELAIKSLKLAIAAFTSENTMQNWGETWHYGRENNVKDTLTEFGFGNLNFYNYDSSLNDSSSKVAFATGEKFYNSDTVIVAIAIRGGGYGLEWADNFNVGNNWAHCAIFIQKLMKGGVANGYYECI